MGQKRYLRPRDVSVWLWARAFWGLPAWLRRGKLATAGNVKSPTVFPFVKGRLIVRGLQGRKETW